MLVERRATGGQAGQSCRIENYLGFPDGVSGAQLTERARRQALKFGVEMLTTRDVVGLEQRGSARVVRFDDGTELAAHTVILATGVSYRQLDAPGLDDLAGRGVYYGAATTEGANCRGQDVYIVGGANSAGQAAMYFSRHARKVVLLVRGDSLERSMSRYLIDQLAGVENIEVRTCTEVVGGTGDDHLETLTLRNNADGTTETVEASWLFVFIGAAPRTDWLDGAVSRDRRGFVLAGPDLVVGGRRPAGWEPRARPVPPGDQRARRLRRRRRPGRLGQAGGLRRRRGRDGRHPGAPLPGEAMSETATGTLTRDELRTLFLFETLADEQLDWLRGARRGGDPAGRRGRRHRGRAGHLLLRAARRHAGAQPQRRRRPASRSTAPTTSGLLRRHPGLPGPGAGAADVRRTRCRR